MSAGDTRLVARQPKASDVQVSVGDRGIMIRDMDQLARFSMTVARSKSFRSWTDEFQIAVAVQTGLELGMSPIQALNSFYPTPGGRTGMYYHAALALMRKAPVIKSVRVGVSDDEWDAEKHYGWCRVVRLDEEEPIETRFTVAEAKRAGLWMKRGARGDSAWVTWSEDMLISKAVHRMGRQYCSDVLLGVDVDTQGPPEDYEVPGTQRFQASIPDSSISDPTPTVRQKPDTPDPLMAMADSTAADDIVEAVLSDPEADEPAEEEPEPEDYDESPDDMREREDSAPVADDDGVEIEPPPLRQGKLMDIPVKTQQVRCPHCSAVATYEIIEGRRSLECKHCSQPFVI